MYDNYHYPPGADTPDAPWNQPSQPEIDIDVYVSTSLSKSTTITTDDYIADRWEDYERGDEGEIIHTGGTEYDFSDTNFIQAYKVMFFTIPELLDELITLAKEKIEKLKSIPDGNVRAEIAKLTSIIESAEGWTEDDLDVGEE